MSAVLQSTAEPVAIENRYNIYSCIHKGLRGFMTDVLHRWGRMDVADDYECHEVLKHARALLQTCRAHLQHENDFVHPAIEAAQPGASARIAREHVEHAAAIAALETSLAKFESTAAADRAATAERLYRELSLFVAHNFEHMVIEETEHHRVLVEAYSEAEVLAIEHAIVASLSPEESSTDLGWMIPQINASQRAFLLSGMKHGAPPEVFQGVLQLAREALSQRDVYKLEKALA